MTKIHVRAVGVAWYRREDYDAIRAIMLDGDGFAVAFDQWLKAAVKAEAELRRSGHLVERAYIDPDSFPAWCAERGLDVDSKARTRFANEFVIRKHRNQS